MRKTIVNLKGGETYTYRDVRIENHLGESINIVIGLESYETVIKLFTVENPNK